MVVLHALDLIHAADEIAGFQENHTIAERLREIAGHYLKHNAAGNAKP